ncbi:calpastatin [Planctomycetaceae bacterium SCGC AG-212-F19]|nr:calpastatin [Planctomycetaceae bacterium SCGC AG-212-F19]
MAEATSDPHDLDRFVQAQEDDYAQALKELRNGRKQSHWMWYVFPQVDGLGFSPTSKRYSIKGRAEAEAYLQHPVLGPRLVEIAKAAIGVQGRTAHEVFGSPDDMKLKSCATLFALVSPAGSVFHQLLDRYFRGQRDDETLRLVGGTPGK